MTSTAGSPRPSARPVTQGCRRHARPAQADRRRARATAGGRAEHGVELLFSPEEAEKHGDRAAADDAAARHRGRARRRRHRAARADALPRDGRAGHRRELRARRLPELDGQARSRGGPRDASSRASTTSSSCRRSRSSIRTAGRSPSTTSSSRARALGRMIELELAVGGEELGRQPCDGIICSTPSGSTAYNLSNGGPVLMWGLEAIALTYVAAHSLHARPLVIPPGADVIVWNRTADVEAGVLVDGHRVATLGKAERAVVRIGRRALAPRDASGGDLRAPLPPELRVMSDGRLTLRDGRTLAWREYGPADGRPLLRFQGTPGSRYSRYRARGVVRPPRRSSDRLRPARLRRVEPNAGARDRGRRRRCRGAPRPSRPRRRPRDRRQRRRPARARLGRESPGASPCRVGRRRAAFRWRRRTSAG